MKVWVVYVEYDDQSFVSGVYATYSKARDAIASDWIEVSNYLFRRGWDTLLITEHTVV